MKDCRHDIIESVKVKSINFEIYNGKFKKNRKYDWLNLNSITSKVHLL